MSKTSVAMSFGLALLTSIGAASTASANSPESGPPPASVVVKYSDLNLGSQKDAAVLLQRIRDAARHVCAIQMAGQSGVEAYYQGQWCRRETLAQSVAKLGSPTVTEAYNAGQPARTITLAQTR